MRHQGSGFDTSPMEAQKGNAGVKSRPKFGKLGTGGNWVWAPLVEGGWEPAQVVERAAGEVVLKTVWGGEVRVAESTELAAVTTDALDEEMPEDLVMLEDVCPQMMLYCLQQNYTEDRIYSWVGANHSVLVAINPFKQLPIYTLDTMMKYSKPSVVEPPPPHTFAVSERAYSSMRMDRKSQALLISGESGAGKTESTKHCLSFLAEVAESLNNLEQHILNANPVLEAFGNAKTVRNNNSSRFGKWMVIDFDQLGRICGAHLESYMLEASRVTSQTEIERNYHIFYQLLASSTQCERLQLHEMHDCSFLGPCQEVPGLDDAEDFKDTCTAMTHLGFSEDDQNWMFDVAAGVLHLGNLRFAPDGDKSRLDEASSRTALDAAAAVLHVEPDALLQALLKRKLLINGEEAVIDLNPKQAKDAAETAAKQLYCRLFDWLVRRVNSSVHGSKGSSFIGVLDIFGFEIFERNSFEQLCINFCNEKLQQLFNKDTFKEEVDLYKAEGIPFENVPFIDNQIVLDLLEGKRPVGMLLMLDEEVRMPKGSDERWVSKSRDQYQAAKAWGGFDKLAHGPLDFVVAHYAGIVHYDATGFVEKNRDAPMRDIQILISGAKAPRAKELFPPEEKTPQKVKTACEIFRKQLADLLQVLTVCEHNYIRCIKANQAKAPRQFQASLVHEQLTYSGVYEAVKIRRAGYPFRMTIKTFWARFRCLRRHANPLIRVTDERDPLKSSQEVLEALPFDFSKVYFGRTKVFYCAKENRELNSLRVACFESLVPVMQRQVRKAIGRVFLQDLFSAKEEIKGGLAAVDAVDASRYYQQSIDILSPHVAFPCSVPEREGLRKYIDSLKVLEAWREQTKAVVAKSKNVTYEELEKVISEGEALRKDPEQRAQERDAALLAECRALLKVKASEKLMPIALEALDTLELEKLTYVVAQAKLADFRDDNGKIDECARISNLPDNELVALQLQKAIEKGDTERQQKCEYRLKEIKVKPLADKALEGLEFDDLEAALAVAKQENFETDYVKEIARLVALPEQELLRVQVLKAIEVGDTKRHQQLVLKLKELNLRPVVKEALDSLETRLLESVVEEAEYADFRMEGIEECRRLLKLPEIELAKLQLQKAVEAGDMRRQQNCKYRMNYLNVENNMDKYALKNMQGLRGAHEWAAIRNYVGGSMVVMNRQKLSEGYLKFSSTQIHAALTSVTKGQHHTRKALNCFKATMAYMGDRQIPYPNPQAAEIINAAREEMCSEIYAQVMKQLTDNPSEHSVSRGWDLFALLISHAPPLEKDQDYVVAFIMRNGPSERLKKRLITLIFGPLRTPVEITSDEIPEELSKFFSRKLTKRFTRRDIGRSPNLEGDDKESQKPDLRRKHTAMMV